MDLNTRELALLIWLGICLVGMLLAKTVRPALLNVLRTLMHRKIVDAIGLAVLYTAGCVWVLERAGIWEWRNLKTVVLWFVTTAFVKMANTKALERGPAIFGALIREAVAVTAIVVFIGGINTLPFWAEFLLWPFLTLIAAMIAVAEHKPEHQIVLGPLNTVLAVCGLYIVGYSVHRIVTDWQNLDPAFQAREFAIPIALTVMFLPYLYVLMLYMGFERAAFRLEFKIEDRALRRYAWWRGVLAFGLHPQTFQRFIHAVQMADITDRASVAQVVTKLRRARARQRSRAPVDWNDGWSPYDAGDFLKAHGLATNDYHPLLQNWAAESTYLKLNSEILPDHLIYRIEGTETAATELELELDARFGSSPEDSNQRFWTVATVLVTEALGEETAQRFAQAIPTDSEFVMSAGRLTLQLNREDWHIGERGGFSRKLVIRHPAYKDPFADWR
jgi:hypothetical protein